MDNDGITGAEGDCNDNNGWIFPGATEFCDSVDNDCDGDVDEECIGNDVVPGLKSSCGCETGTSGAQWFGLVVLALVARRRG